MRIALVLHGWPAARMGGTGLYVEALSAALRAAGHQTALVVPGEAAQPTLRVEADGAIRLAGPAPRTWAQTWSRPPMDALFAQWCAHFRPEVVHVHHLSGHSWGLIFGAGARTVLTLHDYALPCARGQLVDHVGDPCPGPEPARCAACLGEQIHLHPLTRRAGRFLEAWPALHAQARAALAQVRPGLRAVARMRRRAAAVARLLDRFDVVLSPSEDLARRFAAMRLRVPTACALPLVRPVAPAPPPGEGPVRFLYASAMIPSKGPDRLLRAFAELPAGLATLTFAGPEPAVDGHPGWAEALGARARRLPGVRWLGPIPPEGMEALLHAHDVLVLPSVWPENSPLVVREATAAGLRVIVSAQGGAAELAPEARTVPNDPRDIDVLGACLRAEAGDGRGRRTPRTWPSPEAHAAWLIDHAYTPPPTGRTRGRPG